MKKSRKYYILIIGKKPYTGRNRMGMGGVGIHVMRLTEWLDKEKVNYCFYDLSLFKLFSFIKYIANSKIAHLHSSSPYVRLLFAIVCKLYETISVCTYHGDLGRFGRIKNACDYLSIKKMNYPIVLNEYSHNLSIKKNKNTRLLSAYIPVCGAVQLPANVTEKVLLFRSRYKTLFATNAFAMNYDKNGQEIYGIIPLIDFFKDNPDVGLIVSDSSGDYSKYYNTNKYDNILMIKEPHPFVGILNYVDAFIRYTTTDGDSLSIHEALDMGVVVVATNVVARPQGCILVERDDRDGLKKTIASIVFNQKEKNINIKNKSKVEIFEFYKDYLLD